MFLSHTLSVEPSHLLRFSLDTLTLFKAAAKHSISLYSRKQSTSSFRSQQSTFSHQRKHRKRSLARSRTVSYQPSRVHQLLTRSNTDPFNLFGLSSSADMVFSDDDEVFEVKKPTSTLELFYRVSLINTPRPH